MLLLTGTDRMHACRRVRRYVTRRGVHACERREVERTIVMEDVLTALRSRPSTLGAPTGTATAKPHSDSGAGDAWTAGGRPTPGNPFTLSATARPFTQQPHLHGGHGLALPSMAPPAPRPSTAAAVAGAGAANTPDVPPARALRPSTTLNLAAPPPRPKTNGAVPVRAMPQTAGENTDMDVVGERTSPTLELLANDTGASLQRHLAAVTRLYRGAVWADELIVQAVRPALQQRRTNYAQLITFPLPGLDRPGLGSRHIGTSVARCRRCRAPDG